MMGHSNHSNTKFRVRRYQGGATLVEVLVAVLIFSFGLLGLMGIQSQAMQFSTDADGTNRAATLASEITAQMYTMRTGDLATVAAATLAAWKVKVADPAAGGFAGGVGNVTFAAGVATIEVQWTTPSNAVTRRYTTQFFDPISGGILGS